MGTTEEEFLRREYVIQNYIPKNEAKKLFDKEAGWWYIRDFDFLVEELSRREGWGRAQWNGYIDGKLKIYSDLKKAQMDSNVMRRIAGLPEYDYSIKDNNNVRL